MRFLDIPNQTEYILEMASREFFSIWPRLLENVAFESAADTIEDGKNGIIINNGDINSYARELINLMKNDETRVTMAAEAQRSVSRFSSEAIMNRWQELIDEVCKNKPKA